MPLRKDLLTFRRPAARTRAPRPGTFRLAEIVRLARDVAVPGGLVPRGTEATILQVFGAGEAYQVEFEGAYPVPETVPAAALEARFVQPA